MGVFQDYGHLTERGRVERQKRNKQKRVIVALTSAFAALALIIIAAFAVVSLNKHPEKAQEHQPVKISTSMKAIKSICSPTDYQEACVSSLSSAIKSNSSLTGPEDLIKAAIKVAKKEVIKAFDHASKLRKNARSQMEKEALSNCKELLSYAMDELDETFSGVSVAGLKDLATVSQDLKNWLSAVLTYQETCLNGLEDSNAKSDMAEAMKMATQLTSNSLAIITEASSVLSILKVPGFSRRLLSKENHFSEGKGGFPSWFPAGERRLLAMQEMTPNVAVAKDGSGDFRTITEALSKLPPAKERNGRYVIYIKAGVYDEQVTVTKEMVNVTMYGDGSRKTIITGSKNFIDGTPTFKTATFAAIGDDFMAKAIGFRNTAGAAKHQAVALRVQSDRAVFLNCRMDGNQDTLYAHAHRQYYRSCVITGTIDFIFGNAAAVFQNCQIVVRQPLPNQQNIITAQGRTDKRETTGVVIHKCKILPDKKLVAGSSTAKTRSYLGRPWKQYSRTVYMESTIGGFIEPEGWMPWDGDFALDTLFYGEYMNQGPGATLTKRVNWKGYRVLKSKEEAMAFTVDKFIQGGEWIKATGTAVRLGFFS
ncbi:hypothetical protein AMTRI_Chr13g117490 [Amborella trichopoda]|uniref:Pectinesterase n=1 Tax=Amborella trichopoda TaxID=13333 RepID=W1NL91_AMBTC|nr:pectinesterase [Amborella trichopoda]ERM95990.1 hypothetical protein AMTR_s00129p00028250 [Amborella trichopoda]|eukprot:XP_006828574.1 pectinesterase [Amborella trichopoda]